MPLIIVCTLALIGAGLIVAGLALLAGAAWALIGAGGFLIATSVILTRGLRPNA